MSFFPLLDGNFVVEAFKNRFAGCLGQTYTLLIRKEAIRIAFQVPSVFGAECSELTSFRMFIFVLSGAKFCQILPSLEFYLYWSVYIE